MNRPATQTLASNGAGGTLLIFALVALTGVASMAALLATDGQPVAAIVPAALAAAVWAFARMPLRTSALGLTFLMLIGDLKGENPYDGLWESPFELLGRVLFTNLNQLTSIQVLRLPLMDFLIVGMLALRAWRRSTHSSTIDGSVAPSPHFLNRVLALQLSAIVVLDLWGTARGGNFNESLWQLHHLVVFSLTAFLFIGSLRVNPSELRAIARLLVAAAVIKSFCGIYFIYFVARPAGEDVEFTTSHSDTLLFVVVLAGYAALFFEKPTRSTLRKGMLWLPIVIWGLILNDRRIAYVSLGASLLTIFALQPVTRLKRSMLRTTILLAPVIALYVSAGWNREGGVWGPAHVVQTLIQGDPTQAGADYRDIENADVIATWWENAVLPLGFGFKFSEPVVLPDISKYWATFQFHPHNQLLWMWTIGGVFGFTTFFAPWVLGMWFAARAYPRLKTPEDRTAALACMAMIIASLNQVYGDLGTRSYFVAVLGALALAVSAKLAARSGGLGTLVGPASVSAPPRLG